MVLAEVPLWMVHSSSGANEGEQKALSLWQGKQKCAIYSIDMFPPLVATAGGDGTVKIWNSRALFPSKHSNKGVFSEGGDYASSASGGTSAEEDASHRSEEDEAMEVEQVHDLSNTVRRKKDGSPRKQAPSSPPRISRTSSGPTSPSAYSSSRQTHHRLLCTLSAHTGSSVLAVRFSPSGRYLASAGDDGAVCIYAPSGQSQWSRIRLCRGHGLDVVDLAWAPDDSHLVSCSLDSETPIIVWKLNDLAVPTKSMICNPFKVLGKDIHTSTVKGVDFDPAGSYFASSGDDPAVCIWRAHDDWGLEQRIDASSGIFRTWRNESTDDVQTLSSNQSLFRRLSWSTDGSFLCSTNAVVRNKNVASTISREGWNVSSGADAIASNGAANLVGHKQPVVVSRHATHLLDGRRRKRKSSEKNSEDIQDKDNNVEKDEEEESSDDDDDEPEAATLLALGDRRGFVTVWSTRKSRPIFKLQCSESRCTVTDLAWGTTGSGKDKDINEMLLLVSLLDGQVVAIKFSVPDELGPFLSSEDQARVFQLRYGIEMDHGNFGQRRKMLVGKGNGANDLIENALQMSLEESVSKRVAELEKDNEQHEVAQTSFLSSNLIRKKNDNNLVQGGKKRARLLQVGTENLSQRTEIATHDALPKESELDPMQAALDAAEKATGILESAPPPGQQGQQNRVEANEGRDNGKAQRSQNDHPPTNGVSLSAALPNIPHSTNRVHIASLPIDRGSNGNGALLANVVAESTNSSKIPLGSKGNPIPCIDIVIKKDNHVTWSDQIVGTSCTAVSASNRFLAIGTADGSVQLYGSSPSVGWLSANSFRSHPPLIFNGAIVSLRLEDIEASNSLKMLVVTGDGSFGVYNVLPRLAMVKKGSILPPMTHMALSASMSSRDLVYPKLSRLQITRSGHLLLLLSYSSAPPKTNASAESWKSSKGVGGSIQSFVYDDMSELWMRISDSRFVLSDFYSSLPSRSPTSSGILTEIDDSVKLGALESTLKASHRNSSIAAGTIYLQGMEKSGNFLASRSHCEDRLACAVALESEPEYRLWLARFVRILSVTGDEPGLRLLTEMLIGRLSSTNGADDLEGCWWLSVSPEVLKLDRKELVKSIVLPEMSKNRALQRLTNEISLEIENS